MSSKRHPVFILVKEHVFSFAMVFVMGFLMLVSFLFSAAVAAAGGWLGAVIAAVLFEVGRFLLGFYFGRSAIASSYGAAGSLIIILVWVLYSTQILSFGAAFTRV